MGHSIYPLLALAMALSAPGCGAHKALVKGQPGATLATPTPPAVEPAATFAAGKLTLTPACAAIPACPVDKQPSRDFSDVELTRFAAGQLDPKTHLTWTITSTKALTLDSARKACTANQRLPTVAELAEGLWCDDALTVRCSHLDVDVWTSDAATDPANGCQGAYSVTLDEARSSRSGCASSTFSVICVANAGTGSDAPVPPAPGPSACPGAIDCAKGSTAVCSAGVLSCREDAPAPASLGHWSSLSLAAAPQPRSGIAFAWNDRQALYWGGSNDGNRHDVNDGGIFDLAANKWAAMTTTGAPSPREGAHGFTAGGKFLVFGGHLPWRVDAPYDVDNLEDMSGGVYDPDRDAWSATGPKLAPRRDFAIAKTASALFVYGGNSTTPPAGFLNDGAILDLVTRKWTPVAANPFTNGIYTILRSVPRADGHVVVVSSTAPTDNPKTLTYGLSEYDPGRDAWTKLPELVVDAVDRHFADGAIFAAAGDDVTAILPKLGHGSPLQQAFFRLKKGDAAWLPIAAPAVAMAGVAPFALPFYNYMWNGTYFVCLPDLLNPAGDAFQVADLPRDAVPTTDPTVTAELGKADARAGWSGYNIIPLADGFLALAGTVRVVSGGSCRGGADCSTAVSGPGLLARYVLP